MRIGIRREDKSRWEARSPLVPEDVRRLVQEHGLQITVQSSPIRVFPAEAFLAAGARVADTLADCPVILGVKEVPPDLFEPGKTYVYFAHVIKGQPSNMPALRRLLELGCQLIDYERVVDDPGKRLVLFGPFAGQAGMIDTLWALGRRLQHEGLGTPFARVQQAHQYKNLAQAKEEIAHVGQLIRQQGLPEALRPLICGFAGYGAVSKGAQEIYNLLPVEEVSPDDLGPVPPAANVCYKAVFKEEHMVERMDRSAPFELQEYYDHPERYQAKLASYLDRLTALVNGIFWASRYPRMVTREDLRQLYGDSAQPRLRVIGDISCDVDGSLACTVRTTHPGNPVYVYDPVSGQTRDGVVGHGPVVLAVDFLPCELPVDSSVFFSRALAPWVPAMARADFSGRLADSGLPKEWQRATIVYQGQLTEPYRYLTHYLQ